MTEEQGAPLDIKFQQRFSKNLISNAVYFVLQFIIGLALVPFFIDTLGQAAYGLIPLATSVTSYVTIILDSMNASISRFLSIDLQRGELKKAGETYNTALFGILIVLLILLPVIVIVAWVSPSFFNIGTESLINVFWLFLLILGSVLIRAMGAIFTAVFIAYNRLDFINFVNITNILVQLVLVISLFIFIGPTLIFVGISYFAAAIISLILGYILFKKTNAFLHVSASQFRKSRFREIGDQAFWSVFQQIGNLLRYPICMIIVNIMFGEIAGTQFSLGVTICLGILALSSLITSTFRPQIYLYRAKEDTKSLINFGAFTIKVIGLFMALPIALLCVFSTQILEFWVGKDFIRISPLIWIMVIPMIFWMMAACIGPINAAYLKVRPVALTNCILGILNVILAFSFPLLFHNGIYGVGWACAITIFLIMGIFQPIYNAYILKAPLLGFMKPMMYGILALAILLVIIGVYALIIPIQSILGVILSSIIISIGYLIILRLILKTEERTMIRSCIPRYINKVIPNWIL